MQECCDCRLLFPEEEEELEYCIGCGREFCAVCWGEDRLYKMLCPFCEEIALESQYEDAAYLRLKEEGCRG